MLAQTTGLADLVLDAARVYRLTLEAMARPGRVQTLSVTLAPPEGLSPAAAALAMTLVDGTAPAWLAEPLRSLDIKDYLRFHTGADPAIDPGRAAFAFGTWGDLQDQAFPLGSPEYPDRSTTLVIEVGSLAANRGIRLTGPGIAEAHHLDTDLPPAFWAMRAEHHGRFPLGRDVILTCGDRLAALPRTTRAEI